MDIFSLNGVNYGCSEKSLNFTFLVVDVIVFAGVLTTFAPKMTGQFLHEWLGLAFGVTLLVHVILHWQWLVKVTQRFFGR
jgi:hypothetical protein